MRAAVSEQKRRIHFVSIFYREIPIGARSKYTEILLGYLRNALIAANENIECIFCEIIRTVKIESVS